MLVYLTPNDYFVNQAQELCNKIPGHSFIFFSSGMCHYCKDVQPAFLKLSQLIQGCVFGIMNVDQEKQRIIAISNGTKTPLEYVPYIMLYANGRPIAQYHPDESNPEANVDKMRTFLIQQTSQAKRTGPVAKPQDAASAIPPYSIGIPGNMAATRSRKICYLGYESAYKK